MKWRGTYIVFAKELTDILRDRRTLISMVLVPILLYPVLSVGIGKVLSSQVEKTRSAQQTVAVLPFGIDPGLTASMSQIEQLEVIPLDSLQTLLIAEAQSDTLLSVEWVERILTAPDPAQLPDSIRLSVYATAIEAKLIRAIVELPFGMTAEKHRTDSIAVRIYSDETDVNSEIAGDHLRRWAAHLRDSIADVKLAAHGLSRDDLRPFGITRVDVAPEERKAGRILSMILPYMLMILAISGGMYPAIDITAGEKERNTLETLLAAPVARWELAVGKFLTVLTAGFVTMVLATISMTLSMRWGAERFSAMAGSEPIGLSLSAAAWVILLMIPTSTLFAAALIAVAIMARSYKEGQSYVTPMIFLVFVPSMVSIVPGIDLTPALALIPIVNLSLAFKEVVLGTYEIYEIGLVFAVTAVYAAIALYAATRMFQRESVLFRT